VNAVPRLLARRNLPRWFALLACGIALAMLAGGAALAVRVAFDGAGSAAADWRIAAALAACGALAAALGVVERRLAERLAQEHVARVRRALVRALFDREALGDGRAATGMLRFVGDLGAVRDWVAHGAAALPVALGTIPLALALLAVIAPALALPPLVGAVLGTAALWLFGARLEAAQDRARGDRVRLARALGHALGDASACVLHDEERRLLGRLRRCSTRILDSAVARRGLAATGAAAGDAAMAIAGGGVLWLGLDAIAHGGMATGTLAAAITLTGFVATSLHRLAGAWDRWHAVRVASRRLQAHLARARRAAAPRAGVALPAGALGLALDGVRVAVDAPRLDLALAPGEIVCVHADSAGDADALLRVVAGLRDAHEGTVRIGGLDIAAVERRALRSALAVVAPWAGPTPGTWRGHLRRARARGGAGSAAILAEGFAARVGRGAPVSPAGAARQQLLLATAAGVRVLLLAGPTALFDDLALAALLRDARQRAWTVLSIGVDPRMAREADRVLVLDARGLHPLVHATPAARTAAATTSP
jgi:ABC-type multidrug transport system fused ATPase/permease subunit